MTTTESPPRCGCLKDVGGWICNRQWVKQGSYCQRDAMKLEGPKVAPFVVGDRVRVTMERSSFTGFVIARGRLLLDGDHANAPTGPWRYMVQNDAGNVHEYGDRAMVKIGEPDFYRRQDNE